MIKINLLQKKSAANLTSLTSTSRAGGVQGVLDKLKEHSALKRFFPAGDSRYPKSSRLKGPDATRKMGTVLLIYLGVSYFAYDYLEGIKVTKLAEAQVEVDALNKEIGDLDKEIGKRKTFESLKRQLEADEKSVRTKIEVVKKLLDERPTISKLLLALSQATPKDVWISSFQWQDTNITINGSSIGTVVVTDFMQNLEETIFFKELKMKKIGQVKDKGLDIATFELEAKKK